MPEISQTDLDALLSIRNFHAKALANAESRELVQRASKIVNPDAVTDLTVAERHLAPVREELSATKAELLEMKKQLLTEKAEREAAAQRAVFEAQWNDQEASLRRNGYMDGAIVAIKKLAAEKGIVDLTDAAAIYDKNAPPAAPMPSRFSALTLAETDLKDTTDEYMKALFVGQGNAPGAERKQIANAINEARGRAA